MATGPYSVLHGKQLLALVVFFILAAFGLVVFFMPAAFVACGELAKRVLDESCLPSL